MINNHEELIKDIVARCKVIVGPEFNFKKNVNHSLLHYVIEGTDEVENYNKDSVNIVKALHWFDAFWLFMEIRILSTTIADPKSHKPKQVIAQNSISISVYKDNNINKIQLFRAEWDDFLDDEVSNHPQPHWHITVNNQDISNFVEFVKESGNDDFASLIDSENKSQLKMKDMHFAMSSRWHLEEDIISKIENNTSVIKWIVGLLNHIEKELRYITY